MRVGVIDTTPGTKSFSIKFEKRKKLAIPIFSYWLAPSTLILKSRITYIISLLTPAIVFKCLFWIALLQKIPLSF